MTTINALPFTKALKALLEEALGENKPVGWNTIPKLVAPGTEDDEIPTLIPAERPFAILYPLWRNLSGPFLSAPDADAELVYQVSLFAKKPDQLEWMKDKILSTILGRGPAGFLHPIEVDGIYNSDRTLKEDSGGGLDDLSTDPRFGFNVTPRGA